MTGPSDADLLASLDSDIRDRLEGYIEALLEANARFNLTAVRDREQAWERHIIESLRLLPHLGTPETMLDVGTGGGLPGMVLAISRPDIQVSLLEATEKKARFLCETAELLKLKNVSVIAERAEHAGAPGSEYREAFDLVTARAVAALPTLLELTIPFVRPGGLFLSMKGERAPEELQAAEGAMKILDVQLEDTVRQPSATLLFLRKLSSTKPRYPRRSGEPKRKPLGT